MLRLNTQGTHTPLQIKVISFSSRILTHSIVCSTGDIRLIYIYAFGKTFIQIEGLILHFSSIMLYWLNTQHYQSIVVKK